ncbi:Inherit from bctoNOG: PKD domain containing protein [Seminavis robusta]|uniref:Inherit from bctoNOG: PKD domain containing protein n=1 Tax=Seminavis robusta TaxID=568900 RepID=A0A9N8H7D8_9STRA|nr:Inherit from bctoNOG: PKD domain containing protein [Seminavis robusta]|eukprot:Sro176_g077260.1 Inherit from bctoNOG: PKD domain containing protein (422) ;mRNA; f:16673-17938
MAKLYCDDNSWAAGTCTHLGGQSFQLTPSDNTDSAGAIWNYIGQSLDLTQSFMAEADLNMMSNGSRDGGIAFVLQECGTDCLGASGSGLGYRHLDSSGGTVKAIRVDSYTGGGRQTEDSHVSICEERTGALKCGPPVNIGYARDGLNHTLRILYYAPSTLLQVHWDGRMVLSETVNLRVAMGTPEVLWGFTASGQHQVVHLKSIETGDISEPTASPVARSGATPSISPSAHVTVDPVIFQEDFESETTDFLYSDNLFLGTKAETSYMDGEHSDSEWGRYSRNDVGDPKPSGGLRLQIATEGTMSLQYSAGWEVSFDLVEFVEAAVVSFQYRVRLDDGFGDGDQGQVLFDLDGSLTMVDTFNGSDSYQEDWNWASVNVGFLAVGRHTVKLGAWFSQATAGSRLFVVRFDNFFITNLAALPAR